MNGEKTFSQSCPGGWAIIRGPWYPRYKTPTVAPERSVRRVAGAGRLLDGRIGTHMV
jgi:hypothetical protein